jgi:hypothetical protein
MPSASSRCAAARHVVRDRLDIELVEVLLQRAPHLDVPPEPHEEEQRRSVAAYRDAQQRAVDADELEDVGHFRGQTRT